jgi:hypothetical protein
MARPRQAFDDPFALVQVALYLQYDHSHVEIRNLRLESTRRGRVTFAQ